MEQGGTEPRGTPGRSMPLTNVKERAPGEQSVAERNKELMQTLDDAWNGQDLDTFAKRHRDDVVVRWPGQPETQRHPGAPAGGHRFLPRLPGPASR